MADFATSAGHWYEQNGTPKYTIIGANGKERNTTLRDARKLGLVPSVTTIINILDKPGLNKWKLNQVMSAALTLPKIEGETLKEFEARAWEESDRVSTEAREAGTSIHGSIEEFFRTGKINPEHEAHIISTENTLIENFGTQEWLPEKSVASRLGYGGKVDLHSKEVIVDYKTKEFSADKAPASYDDQCMQLAAYRQCINPEAICANLYISRNNPGVVHLHIWSDEELKRAFAMFNCLLTFWQLSKNYVPSES